MNAYLKVKIKSLAAESIIIRKEELKARSNARYSRANGKDAEWSDILRQGLQDHRKDVVGTEVRCSLLAYGFLNGKSYLAMEAKVRPGNQPDWGKVASMITRFGQEDSRTLMQRFSEWKEDRIATAA